MKTTFIKTFLETIICIVFLVLLFFHYSINKYFFGYKAVILLALIPILLILIISILIIKTHSIIVYKNHTQFKNPVYLLLLFTIIYTFSPLSLSSEIFESEIIYKAYMDKNDNYSYIKFRKNKQFESEHYGMLGSKWYFGIWKQNMDTIFLFYKNEKIKNLGDTVILNRNRLLPTQNWKKNIKHPEQTFILKEK